MAVEKMAIDRQIKLRPEKPLKTDMVEVVAV